MLQTVGLFRQRFGLDKPDFSLQDFYTKLQGNSDDLLDAGTFFKYNRHFFQPEDIEQIKNYLMTELKKSKDVDVKKVVDILRCFSDILDIESLEIDIDSQCGEPGPNNSNYNWAHKLFYAEKPDVQQPSTEIVGLVSSLGDRIGNLLTYQPKLK